MLENDSRPLGKIIATLCQSSGGRDFGKVARKIAYRSRILLNPVHKRSVIPRVGPSLISPLRARSALQFLRRVASSLPLYATSLSQDGDKESLSKKENGRLYGDGQCRGVRPRDTVDCPRKKTRILNGKEWWPNEAKLVDPTAVAPTMAIWKRCGGEDRRGFLVIKTPLLAAQKNRGSGYCDNIFLGS